MWRCRCNFGSRNRGLRLSICRLGVVGTWSLGLCEWKLLVGRWTRREGMCLPFESGTCMLLRSPRDVEPFVCLFTSSLSPPLRWCFRPSLLLLSQSSSLHSRWGAAMAGRANSRADMMARKRHRCEMNMIAVTVEKTENNGLGS